MPSSVQVPMYDSVKSISPLCVRPPFTPKGIPYTGMLDKKERLVFINTIQVHPGKVPDAIRSRGTHTLLTNQTRILTDCKDVLLLSAFEVLSSRDTQN